MKNVNAMANRINIFSAGTAGANEFLLADGSRLKNSKVGWHYFAADGERKCIGKLKEVLDYVKTDALQDYEILN